MTNKDQIIQEMASDMDYATIKHDLWPDDAKEIAKTLIMLGYRKILKGSVVYSREEEGKILKAIKKRIEQLKEENGQLRLENNDLEAENEKLKNYNDKLSQGIYYGNGEQFCNRLEQACKETAEKILNEQYQECKIAEKDVLIARGGNKNDAYYKGFSLGMTNAKMHIQELATRFDVKVKGEEQ